MSVSRRLKTTPKTESCSTRFPSCLALIVTLRVPACAEHPQPGRVSVKSESPWECGRGLWRSKRRCYLLVLDTGLKSRRPCDRSSPCPTRPPFPEAEEPEGRKSRADGCFPASCSEQEHEREEAWSGAAGHPCSLPSDRPLSSFSLYPCLHPLKSSLQLQAVPDPHSPLSPGRSSPLILRLS